MTESGFQPSKFGQVWTYRAVDVYLAVMSVTMEGDGPNKGLTRGIVLANRNWAGHPVGSPISVYLFDKTWRLQP